MRKNMGWRNIAAGAAMGLWLLTAPVWAAGAWIDTEDFAAIANGETVPGYSSKAQLIRKAEKAMAQPVPLLTDKEVVPPSGDKRDYTSLAIYFWPDSTSSDGLPYVRWDGHVNPERWDESRYDARRLERMKSELRALAQGYAVSGCDAFAERAAALADSWFIDPATRMNPRLEYAQLVPGKSEGRHSGIIDTVNLIDVVDALYLLESSPAFPPEKQQQVKAWFGAYTDWLLTSEKGKREAASANNHGVWYDAQVAVFAHYAGRDDVARRVIRDVVHRRLEKQLAPDGSFPLELARTRPMNYSLYVLRGYLTLARVGDELGIDLYDQQTAKGQGLKEAIWFILPYVRGEKQLEKRDVADWKASSFRQALRLANRHYHEPAFDFAPVSADVRQDKS